MTATIILGEKSHAQIIEDLLPVEGQPGIEACEIAKLTGIGLFKVRQGLCRLEKLQTAKRAWFRKNGAMACMWWRA